MKPQPLLRWIIATMVVLFLSPLSALAADGTTSLLDPLFLLGCACFIGLVVVAVFVYQLHQRGVPNDELLDQVKLKAEDEGDILLQRFFQLARDNAHYFGSRAETAMQSIKLPTLQGRYFDASDFLQDVGAVVKGNPTFQATVYLDDALVVAGKGADEVRYYSADGRGNGNISTSKPVPATPAKAAV